MYRIVELIFNNIILIIVILIIVYIVKVYKELNDKKKKIQEKFDKVLDSYLSTKIEEARETTNRIQATYPREDEAKTEIDRLLMTINKGITGTINDKVETSNAINKFKLNKQIDLEKYSELKELSKLGTFTEEDMDSIDNGVAIARREYNALAFQYNEKAGGFPTQFIVKLLKLNSHYVIFDPPKSKAYEENYEVFEEETPELNSITSLNQQQPKEEAPVKTEEPKKMEVKIDHSNNILKPTFDVSINENSEKSDN